MKEILKPSQNGKLPAIITGSFFGQTTFLL